MRLKNILPVNVSSSLAIMLFAASNIRGKKKAHVTPAEQTNFPAIIPNILIYNYVNQNPSKVCNSLHS